MIVLSSLIEKKSIVSSFGIVLQLLFLIFIFALILLASYYGTRFIAGAKIKNMKKTNMKVIETIAIGFNHIHIVKINEQYFLISSSKEGIRMLSEINGENLIINDEIQPLAFEKHLKDYIESFKSKDKNGGKYED